MEHNVVASVSPRSAAWFDSEGYRFEDKYLALPGGKLHYVDEGAGKPIVFVHGTPSWSYEFRGVIGALSSSHRCIAPDHLGFGLSERPENFSYALTDHTENLRRLLAHTGTERMTLVVHDFGGPIGLPLALEQPERIERLVILNSWLWPMDIDPKFRKNKAFVDTWLMKFFYLRANFSASYMVKASWGSKRPLTAQRHQSFKAMFPNRQSRLGTWAFARSLVREEAYFESLHQRLERLRSIPTLVVWGMADGMVGAPHLERWKSELPQARFIELEGVGHFPQEEAPDEVVRELRRFLEEN